MLVVRLVSLRGLTFYRTGSLEEARKQGVSLPVTALVDQFYAELQNMGGARWDTSSLIALLDR